MCGDERRLWRTFAVISFVVQITQCAYLTCYEGSLDNYITTPLENGTALINSTCINTNFPTIVYTFGYRGRVAGPATKAIMTAYLAKKKRNVLLLDWEEEAKAKKGLLGLPFGYILSAVPKAKMIGDTLGDVLVKLAKTGLNMTQIHLLGHSLGAHVVGFAGRRAREQGYVVSRITGLDPARNLFEGSFVAHSGLDRTCARFVDIIHTDPGGYGTTKSTGTVDFWLNYGGNVGVQPGCTFGDFEMFSLEADTITDDIDIDNGDYYTQYIRMLTKMRPKRKKRNLCSHDRSWQYFVEAIAYPTAFPAASAADYHSWANSVNTTETTYLGDLTNIRARGNFYLSTNSDSLYGKGVAGLRPGNQTRIRRTLSFTQFLKYFR